jgi:hypothetical protein
MIIQANNMPFTAPLAIVSLATGFFPILTWFAFVTLTLLS